MTSEAVPVGYVVKMYPRFSETFIVNEILELERQGVDVRIYSLRKPDDGCFHASLAHVRAPVIYLPENLWAERRLVAGAHRALARAYPGRYRQLLLNAVSRHKSATLKHFLQAGVLAYHLRARPVNHLHAHFASSAARVAMFVSLLTGVPYSFTAHAKDIYQDSVDRDLLRDKMRAARLTVTVSDFNRAYLVQMAAEAGRTTLGRLLPRVAQAIPPGRIRRLYNGIDLEQFDPGADAVPQASRDPLILSVGRLVEKKGFEDLICACAMLRDKGVAFRCQIIGKGPLEGALRALISGRDLADRVHLAGPKPQDEVVAAYQRTAVFALPCVVGADGNRDGLPTVLLEAMAMQVPVISTDVTGVPEIVDHGVSGLLVPQHNPPALAVALALLLTDPALREEMGLAGRIKAEREFDLRRNVSVLRQWLSEGQAPAHSPAPALRVPCAVANR